MPLPKYFFNKRATIFRKEPISDGAGGLHETLVPLHTNVPCRLSGPSGSRTLIYAALKVPLQVVMYMDYRPIDESDLVVVDSTEYEILAIRNPSMSNHHLEMDLRTLRPTI